MKKEEFMQYLLKNNISQQQASIFISRLKEFDDFLLKNSFNFDSIPKGEIRRFSELLVENGKKELVLDFLRGLINYANYIKEYDYIVEIIDISESYTAMENLHQRVAENYGEKLRNEIFEDVEIPPLGVDPDKKPEFTKVIMKRLEKKIGGEKTKDLLKPCLHGRPGPIEEDREKFLKINDIDEFLKVKKQELVERLQKHQKEGTLEFAQYVDEDVIKFVENTPSISPGIREKDKIITTKIPYQTKKHLQVKDKKLKGFYSCYCPWVRGAIKNGTENEISTNFCYCSAGYTKKYWDVIFNQSVKVEPIETPLSGGTLCTFAVKIPKEFRK